jgi:SAM-dependent methyltransferase
MSTGKDYVLGSEPAEIARLDAQAASIAEPTRILLRTAGLGPGQRVLDLGCGLGHVSFLVAELVGPDGSVTGLDADTTLLARRGATPPGRRRDERPLRRGRRSELAP